MCLTIDFAATDRLAKRAVHVVKAWKLVQVKGNTLGSLELGPTFGPPRPFFPYKVGDNTPEGELVLYKSGHGGSVSGGCFHAFANEDDARALLTSFISEPLEKEIEQRFYAVVPVSFEGLILAGSAYVDGVACNTAISAQEMYISPEDYAAAVASAVPTPIKEVSNG